MTRPPFTPACAEADSVIVPALNAASQSLASCMMSESKSGVVVIPFPSKRGSSHSPSFDHWLASSPKLIDCAAKGFAAKSAIAAAVKTTRMRISKINQLTFANARVRRNKQPQHDKASCKAPPCGLISRRNVTSREARDDDLPRVRKTPRRD